MTSCCAAPFGTVRPLLRPSWLTAAADHRQNAIAVGLRVGQPLEHDDTAALAAHVAVGVGAEGVAAPVGGQHPGREREIVDSGSRMRLTPAGERHAAGAGAQALHGQGDGDEGRGAGGVERQLGPAEAEDVRDPAGGDAQSAIPVP